MEPGVTLLDLSLPQWIALIGFTLATIGFIIWLVYLVRWR
jgi:hypothetical protein